MRYQDKISLTPDQRQTLHQLNSQGQHPAQLIRNAHIILKSAEGWTDDQMAQAYAVSKRTVIRVRNHFRQQLSLEADVWLALSHKPRSGAPLKFSPKEQALVIATACSEAPTGQNHWTLQLLSQTLTTQLGQTISRESVRLILKKTNCSPSAKLNGASRP